MYLLSEITMVSYIKKDVDIFANIKYEYLEYFTYIVITK